MKSFGLVLLLLSFVAEIYSFSGGWGARVQFAQLRPTALPVRYDRILQSSVGGNVEPDQNSRLQVVPNPKKGVRNITKRWITGLSLGAFGTALIAIGNSAFALAWIVFGNLMMGEYFAIVRATGIKTSRNGVIAHLMCFLTAALFPSGHQLVLPFYTTFLMIWLLLKRETTPTIYEISTAVLGVLYLGYLPSFWIRMRALHGGATASAGGLAGIIPVWSSVIQPAQWTVGASACWWTYTSIVFSDVGAYFVGKKIGKNKLGEISKCAGAASPNKTIQGAVGGLVACSLLSTVGAYFMRWPLWLLTGSVHGATMSFVALIGDLTASLLKRNAKIKDAGTILPGHGGLLDRFDSYLLTAPIAYVFIRDMLPLAAHLAQHAPAWVPACLL
mmetsp:Transcript_22762/g.38119  ORF Transcript_22762/g.38119 Transcript_22762/m.38119 type:complete len:387 (-) Transcript_22762:257-1417(-)